MIATEEAALNAAMDAMRGAFAWGGCDCVTAAGRAFRALHGVDPLGDLAGRYSGPRGALRMAREAGGAEAWCERWFARAGLRGVAKPRPGDLALVDAGGPFGAALGLCVGAGVAVKAAQGMTITTMRPVAGWTCRSSS